MRVPCPAKVNLHLAVGARDTRGYHPLRTIFQAIDLCDELRIEPSPEAVLLCDDPQVPPENTVTKALRLASELVRLPPLRIELVKRIPAESGLGGGSSDAAGLLRALATMTAIERDALLDVASAVGADVPFFLVGGRALGEGYGERLTPLEDKPIVWLVIVRPNVGVSTSEAYAKLDSQPERHLSESDPNSFPLMNDFERVMPCDCEEWEDRLLVHGATGALLCGSGSAVFGTFDSEARARSAAHLLTAEWTRSYGPPPSLGPVWVTRTLTRSESLRLETL